MGTCCSCYGGGGEKENWERTSWNEIKGREENEEGRVDTCEWERWTSCLFTLRRGRTTLHRRLWKRLSRLGGCVEGPLMCLIFLLVSYLYSFLCMSKH